MSFSYCVEGLKYKKCETCLINTIYCLFRLQQREVSPIFALQKKEDILDVKNNAHHAACSSGLHNEGQ